MDMAQRVQVKLDKILMRLKTLKIIQDYHLRIDFCDIQENLRGHLKIIDSILKKCLKKLVTKPKRAEIRNIITELVRKKNLNYVSDHSVEEILNSEVHYQSEQETGFSPTRPELPVQTPFDSDQCQNSPTELYVHGETTQEPPKKHLCEKCGKTFNHTWKWKIHLKRHDFVSTPTSPTFPTLEELQRQDEGGPDQLPRDHDPGEEQKERKISEMTGPRRKVEIVRKGKKPAKALPPFVCHCGKVFSLRKSLKKHESVKHSQTRRELKCSHCQKTFFERAKLNRHMLSHASTGPHQCPQCSKPFARSDALRRHVLSAHDRVKNHACTFCQKKFTLKHNRDVHEENVHNTTENWHECEICGRKFKTKITLKSHVEIHSGKRISCSLCGRIFGKKINYKNHMRKRHFGVSPYQNLLDSISRDEMISLAS